PEQEAVAPQLAQLLDQGVDTLGHLLGRLAARAAVTEEPPSGVGRPDLPGRETLELAVVELEQPLEQADPVAEPREASRLPRAEHRAREHVVEATAVEQFADRRGLE